jgi:hypothetical protein
VDAPCIIDGEAVACDYNGVASFDLVRHRRAQNFPLNLPTNRRLCSTVGGRIVEGWAAHCCAVSAARSRAATMTNLARSSLALALPALFGAAKSCALVIVPQQINVRVAKLSPAVGHALRCARNHPSLEASSAWIFRLSYHWQDCALRRRVCASAQGH